jgi:membrane associated rhomboid family serine protease
MSREPLTLGLIAACVGWTLYARWRHLTYTEAGALAGRLLWQGEYWRLLSAAVLHHMGSWIHLVTNCISLFFVGRVIERGSGRRAFLVCLVGGALAGFAGSLLSDPDPTMKRMGISGGIAALLGLLLAIEWAVTKSLWDFLRQRNTLLIIFFLALSVPFAMLVEENVRVDHAGHAGGFLFGLLAGLAYYTRRGVRPARGAIVAAALALLPVAYVSHPFLDPQYQIWRARRAYSAGDFADAAARYERAKELDPTALDTAGAREELLDAYLRVAAEGGPDTARLVDAARSLGGRDPRSWLRFAAQAEAGQRADEAYVAWREAAALLPDRAAWLPLERALRLLRARKPPPLLETLGVARGAAAGLGAGLVPEARAALEAELAGTADAVSQEALATPHGKEVANGLAELYRILAENTGEAARKPRYRLRSADWLWRAAEGPMVPDEVAARFGAALTEAALHGDAGARAAAEQWFRERGLPVPAPDLEGEEGGG